MPEPSPSARPAPLAFLFSLVLSLVLVALGCSSDGGGPAPEPPAPAPTPTGGDVAAPGILRVRIVGLPGALRGSVTVAGPNDFTRTVEADVDLEVPPGTYTVNAGAQGGESGTPLLAPREASQEAVVASDRGTTVRVEYEPLETKLKPDVKEIDASALSGLTSVTRGADGSGTLVFAAATPETSSWKPGDVIALPSTPAAPGGFMGRVVSSDGVTVTTSPVGFLDLYESGGFHFERKLTAQDIERFIPGAKGATVAFGVCSSLSAGFVAQKGPASAALQITGASCFSPTITLDVWTKNLSSLHAYFRVQTAASFTLTAEAIAGIEATGETSLGRFAYPPIKIGPLVIVPEVDFRVFGTAVLAAGLYAGMELTTTTDSGFGYDSNKNPDFRSWGNAGAAFQPIWPTPFANASAVVRGGPQLNLLLSGAVGPFAGVRGVLEFNLDPLGQPLWTLQAGLDIDTGVASASFINKTYAVPVWSQRQVLATSASTPPVSAPTTRPRELPGGFGVAVGPDDTLYLASGNSVKAVKKSGQTVWTYGTDGLVLYVLRAPDGTIYATDFDANVYAIEANGTLRWKAPAAYPRGLALGATHVYTTTYGTEAKLEAFAFADGASWSVPLPGNNWGVSVAKDGTIYALADQIVAIDPTTQQVLWTGGAAGASSYPPAIGDDGALYQLNQDGAIVATNPNGTPRWTSASFFQDAYGGVAIGPDGTIYSCALTHLRAVSPTGAVRWNVRMPGPEPFCRNTPAIGQDKRIYVSTLRGLFVYEPNGTLAWSAPTPYEDSRTSPNFLSTKEVVVAGRNSFRVYYAGTTLPTTGWPREGGGAAATGRKL